MCVCVCVCVYTYIRIYIHIYSEVMKTIQCAHPPHHHNGFAVTCWLWTAMSPQSHCGDQEDGRIGLPS